MNVKTASLAAMAVGLLSVSSLHAEDKSWKSVSRLPAEARVWPSKPPKDCPFEQSMQFGGIAFTGRYVHYTKADGWYPSWAADGNLYSSWADGSIEKGVGCWSFRYENARTGQAKVVGDDPFNLKVVNLGTSSVDARPFRGRYSCGSLVHNGVWYYGTYCLHDKDAAGKYMGPLTWDTMGPFVGWRISTDFGKTWDEGKHTPSKPLFPEPKKFGGSVKLGSPMFVDFGRNMEHSPDGKAYIVAQGAIEPDPKPRAGNCSWVSADQVFLARVTPSIKTINDESQYEYFAGHDAKGNPIWTDDFEKIKPLIDWNNNCGFASITYNAPLKKYFMAVTDGKDKNKSPFDSYILESDRLTGPWRLITYMREFGQQAYFLQILPKFLSDDGRTGWMLWCANFYGEKGKSFFKSDPPGSNYGFSLHEFKLITPEKNRTTPKPADPPTASPSR